MTAGLTIEVHVVCAVLAVVLGPVALFRLSRDWVHRWAGRVWVMAMLGVALSSLFIHTIRVIGPFSPIHILSVVTLVGLAKAIGHLIRREFAAHGRAMRALYLQSLVIAGVFTFLPGRRMNAVLFGGQAEVGFAIAAVVGVAVLGAIWFAPGLRRSLRLQ